MLEELRQVLQPWYLQIKFIHLLAVMIWSFSTAVAYIWFIRSAWISWKKHPDVAALKKRRDWLMEQFDKGASLEHIAFPVLLLSGGLLFWTTGWTLESHWLAVKLLLVTGVFVPMEIVDYWLSHFGGSKRQWREKGDHARHEKLMQWHWVFFRISTPLVAIFIPLIIYLAVVKPAL